MDFSKFKKIQRDDNCTTLQHPSGHHLKIVHKKLSPEFKAKLDELPMHLAKGGATNFDPNMKSKSKPSKSSASSNTMPGSPTEAKNAYTEPQDGGTDIVVSAMNRQAPPFGPMGAEKNHSPPCINPSCKSFGKPHPNCRCYGGKMGMYGGYAEGGEVDDKYFCDDNRAHFKDCEYYAEGGDVEPVEVASVPQQEIAQGTQPETVVEEPAASPDLNSAPIDVPTYQNPSTPVDVAQNTTAALHGESQKLQADLNNGHITPKTYRDLFHEKGTAGKIGTIFGMLVGGMGSGLSHQPNALMQMMDNEINRDLDAQKTSAGNRQNFLKIAQQGLANQAQVTGQNIANEAAARSLAWSAAARTTLHDQIQTAMKLPSGKTRQDAMMALSVLSQGIDKKEADMFSQAGLAQAISESAGHGGNTQFMKSGLMGPAFQKIGEDVEQKTVKGIPGVEGQQASRPIDEGTQKQVLAMTTLDDKAKDLLHYVKENKGTLNPKKRAVALQKIEEMKNFYNDSIKGGALTQGRLGWYDEQFAKHPTDILPQILGSTEKLNEMANSNARRRDLILKSYGLHPKQEKQNVSENSDKSKKGHEIVYKNGKAYYK